MQRIWAAGYSPLEICISPITTISGGVEIRKSGFEIVSEDLGMISGRRQTLMREYSDGGDGGGLAGNQEMQKGEEEEKHGERR